MFTGKQGYVAADGLVIWFVWCTMQLNRPCSSRPHHACPGARPYIRSLRCRSIRNDERTVTKVESTKAALQAAFAASVGLQLLLASPASAGLLAPYGYVWIKASYDFFVALEWGAISAVWTLLTRVLLLTLSAGQRQMLRLLEY